MAFRWLDKFNRSIPKPPDYAEKTLAAYALGIKAKGAIAGVVIEVDPDCCDAARRLPPDKIYVPNEAPRVPLEGCTLGSRCGCVYRPLMKYQESRG